jgi:hypothetical protein
VVSNLLNPPRRAPELLDSLRRRSPKLAAE